MKLLVLEVYRDDALDRIGKAYGISRRRTCDMKLPFGFKIRRYESDIIYRQRIYEHYDKQKQANKIKQGIPK